MEAHNYWILADNLIKVITSSNAKALGGKVSELVDFGEKCAWEDIGTLL
ncbi:hypothetical protein N6147_001917 [Proteus mirabilis]|nr:hypothetical protein [Proteus mirabilis]